MGQLNHLFCIWACILFACGFCVFFSIRFRLRYFCIWVLCFFAVELWLCFFLHFGVAFILLLGLGCFLFCIPILPCFVVLSVILENLDPLQCVFFWFLCLPCFNLHYALEFVLLFSWAASHGL